MEYGIIIVMVIHLLLLCLVRLSWVLLGIGFRLPLSKEFVGYMNLLSDLLHRDWRLMGFGLL